MAAALQLYTVRETMNRDLAGALDEVHEVGFDVVELYDFVRRPTELRQALTDSGLTAVSGHASLLQDDLGRVFDAASEVGLTTVINPTSVAASWGEPDYPARLAERLNLAAESARSWGLTVGYHNHAYEFEVVIGGRPAYHDLVAHLEPTVVLEIDAYWAAVAGVDPVALLGELGPRVGYVHVKDGPLTADTSEQTPIGAGSMPIRGILDAMGQAMPVVEFDAYPGDIRAALAQSLGYLDSHRR